MFSKYFWNAVSEKRLMIIVVSGNHENLIHNDLVNSGLVSSATLAQDEVHIGLTYFAC